MTDKPPLGKSELWITQEEYEDWNVGESEKWEVIDKDLLRARVKIRRIDNGRRAPKEM